MARVRVVVRLDVDPEAWNREYNGNTGDAESAADIRDQVANQVSDLVMIGLQHLRDWGIVSVVDIG